MYVFHRPRYSPNVLVSRFEYGLIYLLKSSTSRGVITLRWHAVQFVTETWLSSWEKVIVRIGDLVAEFCHIQVVITQSSGTR